MIAHDSWWSNKRARFNYHRLSSTIIDYHVPFDQGLTTSIKMLFTPILYTKSLQTINNFHFSFYFPLTTRIKCYFLLVVLHLFQMILVERICLFVPPLSWPSCTVYMYVWSGCELDAGHYWSCVVILTCFFGSFLEKKLNNLLQING